MNTFAVKEKRSSPAVHRRPQAFRLGHRSSQLKAQQAEIQSILRSTGAQGKLTISQPNDRYEQEADHVADQVMRMSDADMAQRVESGTIQPMRIQRICPECEAELAQRQPEEEEEEIQAKFADEQIQRQPEDDDEEVQSKEVPGRTPQIVPGIESRIHSLKGGGQPLDPATRSFFEPRFGHDFSHVRVHSNGIASETARAVNAKAFTLGNDVVFGSGEYHPESREGKSLLGHELAHVLQQSPTSVSSGQADSQGRKETGGVIDTGKSGALPLMAASLSIQRRPSPFIKKITVHLTPPQSADLEWEGTPPTAATGSDHFTVSTGKGYGDPGDPPGTCRRDCCRDPLTQCAPPWNQPWSVGSCCTFYGSNFWTGVPEVEHNGWRWWTPIQPHYSRRGIALHQHTEVTGEPIGHGCVRMDEENAKRIYDYSNRRRTNVTTDGRAAPVACEPDRRCGGTSAGEIRRQEGTATNQGNNQKKVLVTGFNDWRDLGPQRDVWKCNENPSCRLLTGHATDSRQPTSYAGPLVSQLSGNTNVTWEFKTMPVTWGAAAQMINYQNYDAVINMGLGVYDTSDAIQLEQNAYNEREGTDAAGTDVSTPVPIDTSNASSTLTADPGSGVNQRISALDQTQVASQYRVRTAQARSDNNFICNETHYYAISELNRSMSSTPPGRLKLVYFIHLPKPSATTGYSGLAAGTAQVINNLIR